ncbi:MAG: geranylgeranylglycerol-phosphate geranylgeranyltransferase [Flavobacteriales bacterium]|mgnify:CR=1 FL=1|nr:geranylgeranylglycerol-phosphate geranylgeranyltransferase [Flavobacteriales bacterium]MBK6945823.1 geranylgeranylglycerol-phosphate geranylgeranyltransferase [Flavobacteriales bacterium]MBK7241923.1 geranylgeranylglycerol-phosphate geranylgeranyltransferase [Flavobacteriales bacterium]MBK9534626.1 geranylgeranylglycerol-phosphate geranylgeranyltransferase [Flavobacteriales bacterium]MBP9138339.1 geranylgeranylglycerol-phosphate geranylgeranyltransferase [Flavobacteriales bacterium]
MFDLLRLTRPVNLVIIALTMVAIRYGVVAGNLERGLSHLMTEIGGDIQRADLLVPAGYGPQLQPIHFWLLVFSTVLIAAAGNIINDYFDTRIDRINKPDEVIVGRTVKRRVAMTAHMLLSGMGLVIGAFVAWRSGLLKLTWIPLFSIAALWLYSTNLKRSLVIGNVLVATLTALVPLSVGLYEIPLLAKLFADPVVIAAGGEAYQMEAGFIIELWWWVLGFAGFAFLSSLVRELQKDMADVKGDAAVGCRTVPIVWGMRRAKALALFDMGMIIAGLMTIRFLFLHDQLSYWYIGVGITAPLLLSAGSTYNAVSRIEHKRAGNLMKLAMVLAVGFAFLIRYLP